MPCPDDGELAGYLDGALATDARAQIERHIDVCAGCRAALAHSGALDESAGPSCIGRYQLDQPLGAGGMGMVWAAWDPELERRVAIKLLRALAAGGRERLVREARALARLAHPNVVAVHDVGEFEGEVFVATELVDGEAIGGWQRGKTWREIVAVYAQAARGLAAAHEVGLVHRDVKPDNLLVGRDGRVRVGDFGLAYATAAGAEADRLTREGHVVGTPAYMAPEQRDGCAPDPRSDQYAIALSLAEALVGVRARDRDPQLDVRVVRGDLPEALAVAIARGLATDPFARFASMTAFAAALERSLVAPSRSRRAGARRLAVAVAIAAAAVAVAAVVALRWRDAASPRVRTSRQSIDLAREALVRGDSTRCLALLAGAPEPAEEDRLLQVNTAAACEMQAGRCDEGLARRRAAGDLSPLELELLVEGHCPPDQGDLAARLRRLNRQVNLEWQWRTRGCDLYIRATLAAADDADLDAAGREVVRAAFHHLIMCRRLADGCAAARRLHEEGGGHGILVPLEGCDTP